MITVRLVRIYADTVILLFKVTHHVVAVMFSVGGRIKNVLATVAKTSEKF